MRDYAPGLICQVTSRSSAAAVEAESEDGGPRRGKNVASRCLRRNSVLRGIVHGLSDAGGLHLDCHPGCCHHGFFSSLGEAFLTLLSWTEGHEPGVLWPRRVLATCTARDTPTHPEIRGSVRLRPQRPGRTWMRTEARKNIPDVPGAHRAGPTTCLVQTEGQRRRQCGYSCQPHAPLTTPVCIRRRHTPAGRERKGGEGGGGGAGRGKDAPPHPAPGGLQPRHPRYPGVARSSDTSTPLCTETLHLWLQRTAYPLRQAPCRTHNDGFYINAIMSSPRVGLPSERKGRII